MIPEGYGDAEGHQMIVIAREAADHTSGLRW